MLAVGIEDVQAGLLRNCSDSISSTSLKCGLGCTEQSKLCSTTQMCCSRSCCILELETLFFLLLCNDASSLCQYFNALIDVTSLIVPDNLKWAFKHSYWNIDVLAVCLNHWLQGAGFSAVISGDNFGAFLPTRTCRKKKKKPSLD